MAKMKTHKGAQKRFKRTASGKLKRHHAYTSHLLEGKSAKRKRKLRKGGMVSKGDQKRMEQLLTYMK
ncbi:50S ribosomal protein L35 [Ammoniphilus oxalaticus]|uniref:Large ribosomal subunit protein bL35 n=1 Tax=Ammoniphilus oxalaticus TaxID=66863 RepID=A0A419SIG8_9BACL|nr:50S ribosomal protein L35 [Ammoniphilus oxalaticus]RKD23803.1 50S ribosomal protein L35 [Ammoniphilus oxalaticus]